ncbi:MAG: TatD family hydrolase [Nitrososphaerota archaeon]|nr:TatD family hydrolase [Nitrososphaerota archaeon]MDG7051095.1 TatD family hydrolase [Nitrososphaerota archaeon]
MLLYDAHSHQTPVENSVMIPNMERAGIRAVVCITPDEEAGRLSAMREKGLTLVFKGLHPSNLKGGLEIQGEDGIGEIGMDPSYEADMAFQRRIFESQLEIAERRNEPISIHSRGATSLVLSVLSSYRLNGVLLHWFDGTESDLEQAVQHGYYIGAGPPLIYNKRIRKNLKAHQYGLLLLETDAPVFYGPLNVTSSQLLIASVYFAAANSLKLDFNDFAGDEAKAFLSYIGSKQDQIRQ